MPRPARCHQFEIEHGKAVMLVVKAEKSHRRVLVYHLGAENLIIPGQHRVELPGLEHDMSQLRLRGH